MFEKIAAIDIGSTSIKLIKARKKITSFEILSLTSEPIDLSIQNYNTAVKLAVENIINKNNIENFHIVFNLPMEKTIIRNLSFPFSDIDKIAGALPFEAEENIPFKLEDVVMDFQLLHNEDENEARVLLAASHVDSVYEFMSFFDYKNISPVFIGLEANAMYECYRHFDKDDCNIIQLDIGHNKTVINIISNHNLLFTRALSIGTELIIQAIASILAVNYEEAYNIFEKLNIDVKDIDSNLERHFYQTLEIPKTKMKKICRETDIIINEYVEQLNLTLKSFYSDFMRIEFNKIVVSGGGSNISGLSDLISESLSIPCTSLKFLPQFTDPKIASIFATSMGLLLTYLYEKKSSINFLQGSMVPDFAKHNIKQYYFPIFISTLTVIVLLINTSINLFYDISNKKNIQRNLASVYEKEFNQKLTKNSDPIRSAQKLLNKEKQNFEKFKSIIPDNETMIGLINNILSYFEGDESFILKDIILDSKSVKINGETSSSSQLDSFKNKLLESGNFASVDLNTNISSNKSIKFNIIIKLKQ